MVGVRLGGRSAEFWLVVVGTIAGVVGATAAVAVFFFPPAGGSPDPARTPASPSTLPNGALPGPVPTSNEPLVTGSGDSRYLATLTPAAGAGFVQKKGQDLNLTCPTNQSDDTEHELAYELPAPYAQFAARMQVAGQADREATASVQVFIQRRQDRSDRYLQAGDPVVLQQAGERAFTRDVNDAVRLAIRVRCTSSTQVVRLTAPRITR
jgi:hypothetical protein